MVVLAAVLQGWYVQRDVAGVHPSLAVLNPHCCFPRSFSSILHMVIFIPVGRRGWGES